MTDKIDNFDPHAEGYESTLDASLEFSGAGARYYAQRKIAALETFFADAGANPPEQILEFGCGTGNNLELLRPAFPNADLTGIDVSAKSVSIARDRNIERCALSAYDGGSLPFADGRFDLSLAVNVFHHIPPGSRRAAVAEMQRTLKPGGYLVIFEHNPYNPVTRRVVRECPFDEDAVLLRPPETRSLMTQSGLRVVRTMFLIFVPPRLTALLSLEKHLTALPLGAQYGVFARSAPLR